MQKLILPKGNVSLMHAFLIVLLLSYSAALAKELVIALVLDGDTIKSQILPSTKKHNVISQMSLPTHITIMWLKDLPSGNNAQINDLTKRLLEKTKEFLADYQKEKARNFQVVVEKIEKSGNHILGGIYLLPTATGNQVLTKLILSLKEEVNQWKSENQTIPVNFYKYFTGNHFLPHVTILETSRANSIFPSSTAKNNYGKEVEETIQSNKPEGFAGVPIRILHSSWWTQ